MTIFLFVSATRGFLAKQKAKPILDERRRAILTIQAFARGFIERKRVKKYKEDLTNSAVIIQTGKKYKKDLTHCAIIT